MRYKDRTTPPFLGASTKTRRRKMILTHQGNPSAQSQSQRTVIKAPNAYLGSSPFYDTTMVWFYLSNLFCTYNFIGHDNTCIVKPPPKWTRTNSDQTHLQKPGHRTYITAPKTYNIQEYGTRLQDTSRVHDTWTDYSRHHIFIDTINPFWGTPSELPRNG